MKLVFGDYYALTPEIVHNDKEEWIILNLNSLKEGFDRVNLILPVNTINPNDEVYGKEYDILYANYIMNNDAPFMELMKIIMPIYMGKNVFVLSAKDNIYEYVAESLQKFIQSRYGLISYVVNSSEDLEYVEESNFNIYGVANLDIDKERFSYIYASMNPGILRNGY